MSSIVITPERLALINQNRVGVVLVVETSGDGARTVHAFPDTAKGNNFAEELFGKIASEQEGGGPGSPQFEDEEIFEAVESGRIECGKWSLELLHSEVTAEPKPF